MLKVEEYVNNDEAIKRVCGNKSLYKKLLNSFLNDSLVHELAEEFERGDFHAAAKTAHAIKGVSANLSFVKMNEAVCRLEARLKDGNCDERAYQTFIDAFDKTKEAIDIVLKNY